MNRPKSLWRSSGIASPVFVVGYRGMAKRHTLVLIGIPVLMFVSATCVLLVTRVIGSAWAGTDLSVTNVLVYGLFGIAVLGGVQSFFDWAKR